MSSRRRRRASATDGDSKGRGVTVLRAVALLAVLAATAAGCQDEPTGATVEVVGTWTTSEPGLRVSPVVSFTENGGVSGDTGCVSFVARWSRTDDGRAGVAALELEDIGCSDDTSALPDWLRANPFLQDGEGNGVDVVDSAGGVLGTLVPDEG